MPTSSTILYTVPMGTSTLRCIADRKERLLTVYKEEHPVFKKAVYRPGICDEIWVELTELTELTGKELMRNTDVECGDRRK